MALESARPASSKWANGMFKYCSPWSYSAQIVWVPVPTKQFQIHLCDNSSPQITMHLSHYPESRQMICQMMKTKLETKVMAAYHVAELLQHLIGSNKNVVTQHKSKQPLSVSPHSV